MTSFWMMSALLVLVALPFVGWPLLRRTAKNNDVLRDAANLEILRDQAAELDADLKNSLLTQDAYDQGKRELQVRLLDEVKSTGTPAVEARNPAKVLAIVLMALVPLVSGGIYLKLGNSKALLPAEQQEGAAAEGFGVLRSEAALQELEAKLVKLPENPDGWLTLARSYSELQRFDDAVRAYEQLVKLVPNESQVWTNYADAMAMKNGQSLLGEPTKFLQKALELDPENTTALALAGSAGMERGDYVAAITYWQKLISLLPPDYPELQMVKDGVKQAREFLAMQPGGKEKLAKLPAMEEAAPSKPAGDPALAITGKVSLSPDLKAKASPDDFVFILARAAEGPKMPLAVIRKQVKDLPMEFTLDDSMAMQPQMKLSGFAQVVVVARVSKTGTPMSQPGDLEGTAGVVKPGSKGLNITIDTVK